MGIASRWAQWERQGGRVAVVSPPGPVPALPAPSPADTFPASPLGLRIEMEIGTEWVDVTAPFLADPAGDLGGNVYYRQTPQITRGRGDETSTLPASKLVFTLNNRDGRYSPRKADGPYYGKFGRNTPVRVSVPWSTGLQCLGPDYGRSAVPAYTPGNTPLKITGDLDVRFEADMDRWVNVELAGRYDSTGDQRSWFLFCRWDGRLVFSWSTDGTSLTRTEVESTRAAPTQPGRRAVRVTFDVDNGASGNTVTFYTADTIDGTWTQLGDPVTTAGVTSVFAGTTPLEVGGLSTDSNLFDLTTQCRGQIIAFELRSGIGGTLVANPDFSAQAVGAGSFTDTIPAASNLWTIGQNGYIWDRMWRFHGEASDLPIKWDSTGRDVYVSATAQGILRRLQQGDSPLNSALRRSQEGDAGGVTVAYWPMEDSSGASVFGSAKPGQGPARWAGTPTLATYTGFTGSGALPTMGTAVVTATVLPYTSGNEGAVRFLLGVPAAGATDNSLVASISLTGTLARVDVRYRTSSSGSLDVAGFDSDGTSLFSYNSGSPLNGEPRRISVDFLQAGANVTVTTSETAGGSDGAAGVGQTVAATFGRVARVQLNGSATLADTALGHLVVYNDASTILDVSDAMNGRDGEPAGIRILRLASEEGIPTRYIGALGDPNASYLVVRDDCVQMGPQTQKTLVELWFECAAADGGMLYEPRDVIGIGYRARESLYNQTPAITAAYGEVAEVPEPVDDDQNSRNFIVVSRTDGASATAELEAGRLSTQAPPDGIGKYDSAVTLAIYSDETLADQAGYRLLLGTVDEARYPQVTIARENIAVRANPTLSAAAQRAEVGDRILIAENLPDFIPPDAISQIMQGYTELLGGYTHRFEYNATPEAPYQVWILDDEDQRIGTGSSDLRYGVDATAGTLVVRSLDGCSWSTDAGDVPFDIVIGGERITVTAVAAQVGTVQDFTVTRSVNGVVKSHDPGEPVFEADPIILGL